MKLDTMVLRRASGLTSPLKNKIALVRHLCWPSTWFIFLVAIEKFSSNVAKLKHLKNIN
jgi:hypothetical protein